jgi:hypothetical protein
MRCALLLYFSERPQPVAVILLTDDEPELNARRR